VPAHQFAEHEHQWCERDDQRRHHQERKHAANRVPKAHVFQYARNFSLNGCRLLSHQRKAQGPAGE
jgi:hypothetical protein